MIYNFKISSVGIHKVKNKLHSSVKINKRIHWKNYHFYIKRN